MNINEPGSCEHLKYMTTSSVTLAPRRSDEDQKEKKKKRRGAGKLMFLT
jgi:hypothetical protein